MMTKLHSSVNAVALECFSTPRAVQSVSGCVGLRERNGLTPKCQNLTAFNWHRNAGYVRVTRLLWFLLLHQKWSKV